MEVGGEGLDGGNFEENAQVKQQSIFSVMIY